jgi:hypothetical protein
MDAKMHKQIPAVGDENAGHDSASRHQIDDGEGEPYLPEDLVDGVLRVCVMNPVLDRSEGMKHDAMGNVFSERPRHDAATEENSGNGRFES